MMFGVPTGPWGLVLVGWISYVLKLVLLVMQVYAVGDCAIRKSAAFPAADKLTKPGWLLITILALVLTLLFTPWFSLLGIAGVIASTIYLVDVRPAVKSPGRTW